ncbi:MAG: hypothetical protein U1E65_19420 [Myxococcota bacterium]
MLEAELRLIPRAIPLEPRGVLGLGPVARQLLQRVLWDDDARLSTFTGVANDALVVILGQELPWVDGVTYLGQDPRAPGLLLPTQLEPALPLDLVARALGRQRKSRGPAAVSFAPPLIIPLDRARRLSRAELTRRLGA